MRFDAYLPARRGPPRFISSTSNDHQGRSRRTLPNRQCRPTMPRYLLSFYQPQGPILPREVLDPIMRELDAINRDLKTAGSWVFAGGLFPPTTATVVRSSNDEILMTDGPFAEGKEYQPHFMQQTVFHAFFQTQRDHGSDVGKCIKQI